mgnify:CR=1 FL=1
MGRLQVVWSTLDFGSSSPSSLLGLFLRGRDFLLHLISFALCFGILICWEYFGNFGKNPSCINKLICIINFRKLGKLGKCMKLRNSLIIWCSWIIKITRLLNC